MRLLSQDPLHRPTQNTMWSYFEGAAYNLIRTNAGGMASVYCLTLDPYEKYDILFNGAVATREVTTSPGRWAGMDNGWFIGLADEVLIDFNKTIIKYPSIKRIPSGASNDLLPNFEHPITQCH
jgi:hypothetical protein